MHLHDLGNIGNTTSIIDSVLGSIGDINRKNYANAVDVLKTSLTDCSLETVKLVLAQESLSKVQIKAILAAKGLQGEELKLAVAELTADAATKKLTLSTASLTTIMKGLKTAVLTNPLLMATAVVASLFAVYKVVDLLTVSFEEQKEIVNDLTSEVNELQSEYDKLKADPSVNSDKLSALKRQLDLKKEILEIEKETLALKDMQENMPDVANKKDPAMTGVSGSHLNGTWTPEDTAETDMRGDLQKLYQAREGLVKTQEETDALKDLSEHTNTLKKEYLEIADAKARLEQYVDDGTLKGFNAEQAKQQIREYQAELDRLDPVMIEAELALGTAHFTQGYDMLMKDITDTTYVQDNLSIAGLSGSEMSSLITDTQKLNESLRDGKIASKEWFDSINNLMTSSDFADAIKSVDSWNTEATDELEAMVSAMTTQLANGLTDVSNQFLLGETSVSDYIDELQAGSEAQMTMLESVYDLEVGQDGLAKVSYETGEIYKEAAEEAADAYNELAESQEELEKVQGLADILSDDIDFFDDYQSWTEDMLDDKDFQSHISNLSEGIATYLQGNEEAARSFASTMEQITGESLEVSKLMTDASGAYIQQSVSNNLAATQGMTTWTMDTIGTVVDNASQAIGDVLTALGGVIEGFEYSIEAKPYVKGEISKKLFEIDDNGDLKFNGFPAFGIDFSGKGGSSMQTLSAALTEAGNHFRKVGNQQLYDKLTNIDTYGQGNKASGNGGNTNTTPSIKNPTGKSGSGSSSSTKDPHIAEVDKYKNLTDAVDEYDRKLQQLERTYDNTDSVEERIGLKKAEIKLYKEQKDAIDALNKARDEEISGLVNKLRGQGFKIDYDPATEQLLIHNREHINDLNQSIIEQYEEYIDRVDELNDANKDSADQWDELTSSIVKAGKELKDLEKEKYEDYIEGAEHILRLMENRKDAFGKESAVYTNMMNATLKRWKDLVTTDYEGNIEEIREREEAWMDFYDARIEKEKEILEMQLDDNDRVLDGVIKVIDDQIKALDDQIDGLSKANDERKKALELQKAQAELDKARNQKTRHVLRKGKGWVWEADDDAIKEAEENLSDLEYESKTDALEKEKEALEDLKEKWEEIPDIAEDEQNRLLMIEKLGADAEADILDDRIDVYEDFKDDYIDIQEQIQDKTDELEEHTSAAYLNVVKAFENMAKLAGIGLDTGVTTQTTQSSWYVNKDGTAPSQAKKGDIIYTKGGTYEITGKDENGKFTSKKLDNVSTPITDGMWGKKISEEVIKTTEDVTDSVEDIIRVNEDLVDKTKKQILTDANLQKYIDENSKYTSDEIIALMDNEEVMDMLSDYTDDNSDATEDNTDALYRFIDALANLELEVPLKEMTLENFDDSVMDEKDQAYIKELQRAWNLAMEQGNIELANQIHAMADEARMRYLDDDPNNDYNAIAESFSKLEDSKYEYSYSTQIGGKNGDSEATQKYLDNISWLRGKADWSDEFIDRLDNVVDAIENGSGLTATVYEDQYGRTSTVIDYTDKKTPNTTTNKASSSSGGKTSGQQAMDDNKVSKSDRDKIAQAQKDYNDAKAKGDTAGMKDAHDRAEAIRNQNGYSGGVDGSENIKTTSANTRSVSENTKATTYNADSTNDNTDSTDANTDSLDKNTAEHAKGYKVDVNVNVSGGSSGSSGGSKSSGGSGGNKGGSGDDGGYKMDNDVHSPTFGVKVKKAKGGSNLAGGIYNVNEKGDEIVLDKPDEGNWIRINTGGTVIPHEAAENMWEFGENPKMFLSDVLGYDAMKMNQQIIYTGSGEKVINYNIDSINPTLPNVTKPDEFWDEFTRNLPNEAKQWSSTGY